MPDINLTLVNATIMMENAVKTNSSLSPMEYFQNPLKLTTQDLVNLCGSFGTQAKVAAFTGMALVIFAFFWFGKYRPVLRGDLSDGMVANIDKLTFMGIALCFAWIIAKLYYGG